MSSISSATSGLATSSLTNLLSAGSGASNSASGSLAMSGVNSGIDTTSIVQKIMAVESLPLQQLQSKQSTYTTQQKAFEDIKSSLDSLNTLATTLKGEAANSTFSATSSDESVVIASSSTGGSEGTHSVEVGQLATADKLVNGGVAGLDTLVGAGNFVYTYNGVTRTVVTDATTKLQDLVNLVNNDSGNPGVSASILDYDVTGSSGHRYHLVLSGKNTGAAVLARTSFQRGI